MSEPEQIDPKATRRNVISSVFVSVLIGLAFQEMILPVRDSVRTAGITLGTTIYFSIFFLTSMRFFIGNQLHLISDNLLHMKGTVWFYDLFWIIVQTTALIFLGGVSSVEANRASKVGFVDLLVVLYACDVLWIVSQWVLGKLGSPLFRVSDLKDPSGLAVKLRDNRDPVSQYLRGQFSLEAQRQIEQHDGSSTQSGSLKSALVVELNQLLKDPGLFDERRFAQIRLSEKTRKLIEQKPQREGLISLNRLLLEEAYPHEIFTGWKRSVIPWKWAALNTGQIIGILIAMGATGDTSSDAFLWLLLTLSVLAFFIDVLLSDYYDVI